MLARQVAVGRDEIDIVGLDPGPPRTLVFVEVRSHSTNRYGLPEENVDQRKVGRLYRGALALLRIGGLPDGSALPRMAWRADLILVDVRPTLGAGVGGPEVRQIRGIRPD